MSKKLRLSLFIALTLLAFAYPLRRIVQFELPTVPPTPYLFELSGEDPVDLFMGHYLRLSRLPNRVELPELITSEQFNLPFDRRGDHGYVILSTDESTGLAKLTWSQTEPKHGDYLKLLYSYQNSQQRHEKVQEMRKNGAIAPYHPVLTIGLPMQRFHINESIAQPLERAVSKLGSKPGAVKIRILVYPRGHYMLDDILLEGIPYRQYLRRQSSAQPMP